MAKKTEKGGIFRNVHCRTWNMARKLKIRKMRNTHFRTLNMARKTEKGVFCISQGSLESQNLWTVSR